MDGIEYEYGQDEEMAVDNGDEDVNFHIHYGTNEIQLTLRSSDKIESLKSRLQRKTGLKPDQINLLGWDVTEDLNDVTLHDVGISGEQHIILQPKNSDGEDDERLAQVYHLMIEDKENDEQYNLFFNGLQSVQDVKSHIATIANIPIHKQIWEGWPEPCDDFQYLYEVGLSHPVHPLSVSSRHDLPMAFRASPPPVANNRSYEYLHDEDGMDVMHDDEEDVINAAVSTRSRRPGALIPTAMPPEADAVKTFVQNFEARYGSNHAHFFEASLRDASDFAFNRPAPNRQLLAIYLHHDKSIGVNIFVSQILQHPPIMEFLNQNAVIWPWDVTEAENRVAVRNAIMEIISDEIPMPFLLGLSSNVNRFPYLMIFAKVRGSVELVRSVDGMASQGEALDAMEFAANVNLRGQELEVQEQQARVDRAKVMEEQNEAYQQSLLADRMKAKAKEDEEEKKKQEENKEKQKELEKERLKEAARASLGEEPAQGTKEPVTMVRLKTPDGQSFTRRFLSNSPLRSLFNFAHANGYPVEEFHIVATHPRRELTNLDPNVSFKDLGLPSQLALFVEER